MQHMQNWPLLLTLLVFSLYLADVAARPHHDPGIQSAGDR
jgi:hypothetical protein